MSTFIQRLKKRKRKKNCVKNDTQKRTKIIRQTNIRNINQDNFKKEEIFANRKRKRRENFVKMFTQNLLQDLDNKTTTNRHKHSHRAIEQGKKNIQN